MKTSRLLLAFLLALVALPLAAQVNDTYVIPVSANVDGAFNTRWLTQFSIFNPQLDYSLKVAVVFLPTGGGEGSEALITVPPNSLAFTDNILGDLFRIAGSGALLVATFPEDNPGVPNDVLSRSFLVTTHTFNNSSSGTYSQTIPGIWTGLQDYQTDGISAVVHGIRNIERQGWRTNIGAVNLGRRSVNMRVSVYDAGGRTILRNAPFTIPPMGHVQDRLPIEVDRGTIEFFVDDPSQESVVFPYSSTIDRISGDPRYQTPILLASPGTIFGKRAVQHDAIGKKIDLTYARAARENSRSLGEVQLVREAEGWRITQ